MKAVSDRLLEGAIDVHAHSYPEYTLSVNPRLNNIEWAQLAKERGMRGILLKSSVWPTMMQAYDIKQLVDDIEIMGSIVLNFTVGGLSPTAVAIAGEMGAKAVFMPTWSAQNDINKSGATLNRLRKVCASIDDMIKTAGGGITVLDGNGKLKPEADEILDVAKSYNMYIASGHLHIDESIVYAEAAARKGVRFSLTHPHNTTIGATPEQQKYIAQTGGYVEQTFVQCMPMHLRVNPKDIAHSIEVVGVSNTILATDSIAPWNPPAPEVMRMFIESMLHLGFSEEEISIMVKENPAKILDLD